eukprot:Pgem_evm1s9086
MKEKRNIINTISHPGFLEKNKFNDLNVIGSVDSVKSDVVLSKKTPSHEVDTPMHVAIRPRTGGQ